MSYLFLIPFALVALFIWLAHSVWAEDRRTNRLIKETYDTLMARARAAQTRDELTAVMLAVIEQDVLPGFAVGHLRFYLEGRMDQITIATRAP